jgi:DNA modification methylase
MLYGGILLKTTHKTVNTSSVDLSFIENNSVDLVVTSPPYPMIEMWNDSFCSQNRNIQLLLNSGKYDDAFNEMHNILQKVWVEIDRVLTDGGFVCINIGDATKNCDGIFRMFSNHSKIISFFSKMGYSILPDIIWRKQTNAPNKFMGSGMYPAGAYVTFEHEYILIFRKGRKREFKSTEKKLNRQRSAYFWEERNIWFSDLWDIKGVSQIMKKPVSRDRSGAFPFELAYRLINMYSVKGDTVLDPFAGTGTVAFASIASERNSINIEIDTSLYENIFTGRSQIKNKINVYIKSRIKNHIEFINKQKALGKEKFYINTQHNLLVKTRQEKEASFSLIESISKNYSSLECTYNKLPCYNE